MIGTRLAHYEITGHLGSGGMGEVYQATDTRLGRSVAIKILPDAFTHDTDRLARFEREARALASLNLKVRRWPIALREDQFQQTRRSQLPSRLQKPSKQPTKRGLFIAI